MYVRFEGLEGLSMSKVFYLILTLFISINDFTYSEEKISSSLEGVISVANASGDIVPAKDILIWVNIPDHSPSRKPRVEKMNQKNKEFEPRVMIAPVNTEVYFPNLDQIYHSIFSLNNVKKIDLGKYKGKGEAVIFEHPGIYPIGCEIHPWMSAFVVIVDTPFYAKSGLRGNYRIRDLVPGKYTFEVWSSSFKEQARFDFELKPGKNIFNWSAPLKLLKKKIKRRNTNKKSRFKGLY